MYNIQLDEFIYHKYTCMYVHTYKLPAVDKSTSQAESKNDDIIPQFLL